MEGFRALTRKMKVKGKVNCNSVLPYGPWREEEVSYYIFLIKNEQPFVIQQQQGLEENM